MKKELIDLRKKCSEKLGFDISKVEQCTDLWHVMRCGVVTASKAYILLMEDKLAPYPEEIEIVKDGRVNRVEFNGKKFEGTKANCTQWVREQLPRIKCDTKTAYLDQLVASIATGCIPDEVSAKPLEWGKKYEFDAREAYSAATWENIEEEAFIYKDISMRAGISPDGLIMGQDKGLELKCPWNSGVWVSFAARNEIKKEEMAQVQFSMLVTGYESWGFAKFDPRNVNCKKLHYITIERDEEMIKKLQKGLDCFIKDMDVALERLGLKFGDQWAIKNGEGLCLTGA